MKALVLAALVVSTSQVQASCHHFKVWKYPWPQRCPVHKTVQSLQKPVFLQVLDRNVVQAANRAFAERVVPLADRDALLLSRAGMLRL